ncbi:hypothetical protein BDR26DRAFT_900161 [Obelidium mucronatum]|nr:hypothetical protein BDR26DRAFT_900161 [Obelidium mucronatum]
MPNTVAEVPLATQAHTNPLLDADDAFAAVFNDEEEETALPAKGIFYGNQYPQLPQDEFLKPLIENYFWKGYSNKAITDLLEDLHGVKISWGRISRSRESLKQLPREIEGINSRVGYREMTRYLRERHQIFAKEFVLLVVALQWSAGPNDRWCFDGHDKLNKYFLAIHGCKDFWSGKWIWLRVLVSNHNPRVILLYYLEAVKEHQGSDRGTETVDVAAMQAALHDVHKSGFSIALAHRYVPSTRNTKIESAWTRWLKARGYTLAEVLAAGFEYPSSWEENDQLDKYIYLYVWIPFTQSILDEYAEHVNNNTSSNITIG